MQSDELGSVSIVTALVTVMLSGCGGSQPPIGGPGEMPQSSAIATHADRGKSWMLPEAKSGDLLYASDPVAEDVYIYDYPQLKSVTTMTGFLEPYGLCSDAAGDVFISSESRSGGSSAIYEYPHGGASPIATLNDPGIAFGCAVDPRTGDLAVANRNDDSNPGDAGDVAVYPVGSGSPTIYYNSEFSNFLFCGYDNRSNLFLSALSGDEAVLASLPSGGTSLEQVSLKTKLYFEPTRFYPSVQWDGRNITVSSYNGAHRPTRVVVYRLRISGSRATVTGTTRLDSESARNPHVGQISIQRNTLIAPYTCCEGQRIGRWAYPGGGLPRNSIKVAAGNEMLWGVAVSSAPSR